MRAACTYSMEAHVSTPVPADWRLSTFSTFSFGGAAAFSSVAASAFSVCLRSRRVDMRSDIAAELASGGGGGGGWRGRRRGLTARTAGAGQ